eukprot:m.214064 g.214064  ORF g.214064 m.214064 type:complete len:239 (+) comp31739_c0_seq1:703-1419(+)
MSDVTCSNCEEQKAAVRCTDCDSIFCEECNQVLHKSAKKKTHVIVNLDGTATAAEPAQPQQTQQQAPAPAAVQPSAPAPITAPAPTKKMSSANAENTAAAKPVAAGRVSTSDNSLGATEKENPDIPNIENIHQWTKTEVGNWLASLGPSLKPYVPVFHQQEISGAVLGALTLDNLRELRVQDGDLSKLFNSIIKLRLQSQRAILGNLQTNVPQSVTDALRAAEKELAGVTQDPSAIPV